MFDLVLCTYTGEEFFTALATIALSLQYMKYLAHSWTMGRFLCYGLHYVQQFSMICSVMTLTVISVERFEKCKKLFYRKVYRYLAIAFPMKSAGLSSMTRVKKVIVSVWILSAILAAPAAVRIVR